MSKIKIGADISEFKKSIVDASKEINKLSKTQKGISLFDRADRNFLKRDLKDSLKEMNKEFAEGKIRVKGLLTELKNVKKGSEEELSVRKKITAELRTQSNLAQNISSTKGAIGGLGGIAGGLSKFGKFLNPLSLGLGVAAAGGAWAVGKGLQGKNMFHESMGSQIRLSGMGLGPMSGMSASQLAAAGLTENDMIGRRVNAASILGRGAGSASNILQQASFERAMGLQGGSLMNVSTSLRSQFGGAGADSVQLKLQASILANGIEDALAPYLEAATSLLAQINENGVTSTDEMIGAIGYLTKTSNRPVEQIARMFGGMDSAVRGSSGEANAIFQTAFARAGIGGGTIGGTQFALESGGITGLSGSKLLDYGWNKDLVANMSRSGLTNERGGLGRRNTAILNMLRGMGGVSSLSGITDQGQMVTMNALANSMFGTKGEGGFSAALLAEQLERGEISQGSYQKKLKDLQAGEDPVASRLNAINSTLAGHTDKLTQINATLTMGFGLEAAVPLDNLSTKASNLGLRGMTEVAAGVKRPFRASGGTSAAPGVGPSGMIEMTPESLAAMRQAVKEGAAAGTTKGGSSVVNGERVYEGAYGKW